MVPLSVLSHYDLTNWPRCCHVLALYACSHETAMTAATVVETRYEGHQGNRGRGLGVSAAPGEQ